MDTDFNSSRLLRHIENLALALGGGYAYPCLLEFLHGHLSQPKSFRCLRQRQLSRKAHHTGIHLSFVLRTQPGNRNNILRSPDSLRRIGNSGQIRLVPHTVRFKFITIKITQEIKTVRGPEHPPAAAAFHGHLP